MNIWPIRTIKLSTRLYSTRSFSYKIVILASRWLSLLLTTFLYQLRTIIALSLLSPPRWWSISTPSVAEFVMTSSSMPNGGVIVVFYASNAIRESIVASSEIHLSSRTSLNRSDVGALSSRSRSGQKEGARTREKSDKSDPVHRGLIVGALSNCLPTLLTN